MVKDEDPGTIGLPERAARALATVLLLATASTSVGMSDAGEFGIDNIVRRTEIRARDAVVPGEFVFVPLRPKKTKEESAGRKHVARGAEQQLTRRWFLSAEIHDAKATKHHAGSGAAKHSEQGKVLKIDDGKSDRVNGSA